MHGKFLSNGSLEKYLHTIIDVPLQLVHIAVLFSSTNNLSL